MIKSSFKKTIVFLALSTAMAVSLTGCNWFKSKSADVNQETKKIVIDKELTDDLKKNEKVSKGEVILEGTTGKATITVKDNVTAKEAEALAYSYANKIKQKNKTSNIDVKVNQKGKGIAKVDEKTDEKVLKGVLRTDIFGNNVVTIAMYDSSKLTTVTLNGTKLIKEDKYTVNGNDIKVLVKDNKDKLKITLDKKDYLVTIQ